MQTLSPSFKLTYINLEPPSKAPVKKDAKIRHYSLYINVLKIFKIYQTVGSSPNKCKILPIKFCKCFWYNSEDKRLSNLSFDASFDCICVASVTVHMVFWSLLKPILEYIKEVLLPVQELSFLEL